MRPNFGSVVKVVLNLVLMTKLKFKTWTDSKPDATKIARNNFKTAFLKKGSVFYSTSFLHKYFIWMFGTLFFIKENIAKPINCLASK